MILLYNFDLLQIHIPYMSQDISIELITAKYLSLFYKYVRLFQEMYNTHLTS
jgi:hypothetical protein